MSFLTLIMEREHGLYPPIERFQTRLDQRIEEGIANDLCASKTVPLSPDFSHVPNRSGNYIAVWRRIPEKNGMKLSLWSIFLKHKLWSVEVPFGSETTHARCKLSERGLVLITSLPSLTIVHEGSITGHLPMLSWHSITPLGLEILGCFDDKEKGCLFGKWDNEGNLLMQVPLDQTVPSRSAIHASNHSFWARLSERGSTEMLLEVVDHRDGELKSFQLPKTHANEVPSTACIVGRALYFGKSRKEPIDFNHVKHLAPTLCIFDLILGTLETIVLSPPEEDIESGELKHVVANSCYVAFVECKRHANDSVKYLEIASQGIHEASCVPRSLDTPDIYLDMQRKILTITYAIGSPVDGTAQWQREVVDMERKCLLYKANYPRSSWGECSMSSGNLLITTPYDLYFESYDSEEPASKHPMRLDCTTPPSPITNLADNLD